MVINRKCSKITACCCLLKQRLLSKVVDNNLLLCKIDTLRYELKKHCPAAHQSMGKESNKCHEKLRTLLELKKKRTKMYFMNGKTRSFGMAKKSLTLQKK